MSPRLLLALTAVALGFAALIALLIPNPGTNAPTAAPAPTVAVPTPHAGGTGVSEHLDADPFLTTVAPATDLPAATAAALSDAADRVCEGLTAEVPVTTIEQTIAAEFGITLPEAHDLVAAAATTRCGLPAPAPAPVVVAPAPAPAPPAVDAPAPAQPVEEPAVEEPADASTDPCYRIEPECYGVVVDYFPQLPEETDARATD